MGYLSPPQALIDAALLLPYPDNRDRLFNLYEAVNYPLGPYGRFLPMASFSIQVKPGFEVSLNAADIAAGTAAPTTAGDLEVRIDLVNATGGAGWTTTKVYEAFCAILQYLNDPQFQTSVPQSLEV